MTLLPDLRRQIYEAADRRARSRRQRAILAFTRLAMIRGRGAIVHVVSLLGTGAAAYGATQLTQGSAARYGDLALQSLIRRDPACATTGTQGHPSQKHPTNNLLTMLGVLRRSATAQDNFPPPLSASTMQRIRSRKDAHSAALRAVAQRRLRALAGQGGGVYVDYVRRSRIAFGYAWYVIPSGAWQFDTSPPARCIQELRHDLPQMSARERQSAVRLVTRSLVAEAALNRPTEAVCLDAVALSGPFAGMGSSSCGSTPAQIAQGRNLATLGSAVGALSLVAAIVPDGVATVTLDFPTGAYTGASGRQSVSVVTRPVNNVMVAAVPASAGTPNPRRMIWRSAGGTTLRVISEP